MQDENTLQNVPCDDSCTCDSCTGGMNMPTCANCGNTLDGANVTYAGATGQYCSMDCKISAEQGSRGSKGDPMEMPAQLGSGQMTAPPDIG